MSKKAKKLREEAETIRRAAMTPTTGGHGTDRLLCEVAARLEFEASKLECETPEQGLHSD